MDNNTTDKYINYINIEKIIPAFVIKAMDVLINAGHQAYLTGGCVRDLLIGRIPSDWDIATSAKPQIVINIFEKTIDTGAKHGTVIVVTKDGTVEITSFRIDSIYTDFRHPDSVVFASDIMEDLSRRDFTINALALNRKGLIIDHFNGLADLQSKIIRCVGNPDQRFKEDALRMLRCIRFSAQLGFKTDTDTLKSLVSNRKLIVHVSKERINNEMCKILLSSNPYKIYLLVKYGFLEVIIPETKHLGLHNNKNFRLVCSKISELPYSLIARLAFFLIPVDAESAHKILQCMRFEKKVINDVLILLSNSRIPKIINGYTIRKILSTMGSDLFKLLVDIWYAEAAIFKNDFIASDIKYAVELFDETIKLKYCTTLNELAVNGNDLLINGIKEGPNMGIILNNMFEAVLREPWMNQKDTLLKTMLLR